MLKQRNINIDLLKVIAVFSVISIHFFLNTNFYNEIITKDLYFFVALRTLFMICVPLFIVITGFLMKNATLSKKYYLGISKVLIIYILASIFCYTTNHIYNGTLFTFRNFIKELLNIGTIGYSWYVEMYIGLFLLIPFINLIYNNLKSKKEKKVLLLTMIIITSIPSIINIENIILPDWWINIYPLTYYFIGCYLREYKIEIKKLTNVILFITVLLISSLINIYLSNNINFIRGPHNDWGSILNLLTTVLLFIFIINLDLSKINNKIKKILIYISNLSFGMYLTSYVMDTIIYKVLLNDKINISIKSYLICVTLVFVTSIGLSMITSSIHYIINKKIITRINVN